MKKHTTPVKLTLKLETVKLLDRTELPRVVGGVTTPCAQPTTTVHHTFDC